VDLRIGATDTDPEGGTVAVTKSATFPTAGYHVIPFDAPLPTLPIGGSFSVVQTVSADYTHPVAIESKEDGWSSNVTSAAGQSFYYSGGTWKDLYTAYFAYVLNFCIKVYATEPAGPSFTNFSIPGEINHVISPDTGEILVHLPVNMPSDDLTPVFSVVRTTRSM
jgi:hypothetical protein